MHLLLSILYFTTILLTVVTAAVTLPESGRVRRDSESRSDSIRVIQGRVPATGVVNADIRASLSSIQTDTTQLNQCILAQNSRIPSVVILTMSDYPATSLKLVGSSKDCFANGSVNSANVSFGNDGIAIINPRRGFCSFRLVNQPRRSLNVSFIQHSRRTYNETVASTSYCPNLCASSLWDKYPVRVIIKESRSGMIRSTNLIKIFSDGNCSGEEIHPGVRNGNDLAEVTLEKPLEVIKSFEIRRN